LAREDAEKELSEAEVVKREIDHEARSLWGAVNGNPGDLLYAGPFDGQ
jgi:hypothetical protein